MDHIAALSKEFSVLTWVSNWCQGMEIRLDDVHSLLHLVERSKFVEHELLGFDLLLCDSGHRLVLVS